MAKDNLLKTLNQNQQDAIKLIASNGGVIHAATVRVQRDRGFFKAGTKKLTLLVAVRRAVTEMEQLDDAL